MAVPALDRVIERFRRQRARGAFPGGQLAVVQNGRLLVEDAVGIARGFRREEELAAPVAVTPDTPFPVMSASKGVVAFAVAVLEDRGLLDPEAPVASVFPEFAQNGKAEITILDVLTHRSGLLLEDLVRTPDRWCDWEAVVERVARAKPEFPRGTVAYESHAYGWVLGEVVRRVTGAALPEFLDGVLGVELSGLHFLTPPGLPLSARPYWLGKQRFMLGGVDLVPDFERAYDEIAAFRALVPGAGMLSTARALAFFYDALARGGVTASGRRLLRAETLERYTRRVMLTRDRITRAPVAFGRGFSLGWALPHTYSLWGSTRCFGHPGGFGVVAFADPDRAVGIAFVTNGHRSIMDMGRRFGPLGQDVRRAVRPRR